MKNIDIKSLIIGALLTSTIFLGVAAVPKDQGERVIESALQFIPYTWDDKQEWELKRMARDSKKEIVKKLTLGHEPFAATDKNIFFRKRIK